MYKLLLIVIMIISGVSLYGQGELDYRLLRMEDGLAHREVLFSCRGPRGFIWIVSSKIQFYDGQNMTTFSRYDADHHIPVSDVKGAFKYGDSLLIFSDAKQFYALNMLTKKTKSFPAPEGVDLVGQDIEKIHKRPHWNTVAIMTVKNGRPLLHVVDNNWNYLYAIEDLNRHIGVPLTFEIDENGIYWSIGKYDGNIQKIGRDFNIKIPTPAADMNRLSHGLLNIPNFGLIIFNRNGKIYAVKKGKEHIELIREIPVDQKQVQFAFAENDSLIWIIGESQVARFNLFKNNLEQIFDSSLFNTKHAIIFQAHTDHEGITWISSDVGLLKLSNRPRSFFKILSASPDEQNIQFREIFDLNQNEVVTRAFKDQRSLIKVTFDASNYRYEAETVLKNIRGDGRFAKFNGAIYRLSPRSNTLERYDPNTFKRTEIDLPQNSAFHFYNPFFIDTSGMVYYQNEDFNLSTYNLYTKEAKELKFNHLEGLSIGWRNMKLVGANEMAIGSVYSGVYICDLSSGRLKAHYHADSKPALSSDQVNDIFVDSRSDIWVGTRSAGLNLIRYSKNEVVQFSTRDGLPNNVIASIIEDLNGDIWIGTYFGLSRFDRANETFQNYYVSDGLPNNELNFLSTCRMPDGRLFMGTLNGMVTFLPEEVNNTSDLPKIRLTSIRKYNRKKDEVSISESNLDSVEYIVVSPYDNYIDLEFAVPGYTTNATHNFRAKLEGLDEDWQDLGRTNSIRYQKLPAGIHKLMLKATDAHGNETISPLPVMLEVKQIFYKSSWFVILMIVSIGAILYGFYRYRISLLRKEAQTRTRIASDLHDEVGSSLTGLSLKLQMMELQAAPDQRSHLESLSIIINSSVAKMRDLVWSVDSRSDRWEGVIERMQDYAIDTLSARNIVFNMELDGIELRSTLDARLKHNLYLIFKESINNVAKHSTASEVVFQLIRTDHQLTMRIQDNGEQRGQRKGVKGQGLQNLYMRAERLKGDVNAGFNETGFEVKLVMTNC